MTADAVLLMMGEEKNKQYENIKCLALPCQDAVRCW